MWLAISHFWLDGWVEPNPVIAYVIPLYDFIPCDILVTEDAFARPPPVI